jgi:hypothetical protein
MYGKNYLEILSLFVSYTQVQLSKTLCSQPISTMLQILQSIIVAFNLFVVTFLIIACIPQPINSPRTIIPANSTLGFGSIIAVSHAQTSRRANLLWAANLTDIDIVIPDQPAWTESDIENFKSKSGSKISRGSALAWMGHLNALKWYVNLSSHLTTSTLLFQHTLTVATNYP